MALTSKQSNGRKMLITRRISNCKWSFKHFLVHLIKQKSFVLNPNHYVATRRRSFFLDFRADYWQSLHL